jgi:hypothetical protein
MSKRPMGPRLVMAGLAMACAAGPLSAQSSYEVTDDARVTVQNNRDEEVTVYLDTTPFERRIGTVGPMRTETLSVPEWALRGKETVKLILLAEGELPLQAEAMVRDEPMRLAVVVPGDDDDVRMMSTERVATVLPEELLEDATVTVRNERDEAADVFIQWGSFDHRLGEVAAGATMTFAIPEHLVGRSAQIVLVPDDGLALASSDLSLEEGTHLGVTLD